MENRFEAKNRALFINGRKILRAWESYTGWYWFAVEKVEDRLGDGRAWLMRDFSIADLETYGWLSGMAKLLPGSFEAAPKTHAWLERVRDRPAVAAALARATVSEPETVWAPGPEINRWG